MLTGGSKATSVSCDVIGKDNGTHRSLAWATLAHQKHLCIEYRGRRTWLVDDYALSIVRVWMSVCIFTQTLFILSSSWLVVNRYVSESESESKCLLGTGRSWGVGWARVLKWGWMDKDRCLLASCSTVHKGLKVERERSQACRKVTCSLVLQL